MTAKLKWIVGLIVLVLVSALIFFFVGKKIQPENVTSLPEGGETEIQITPAIKDRLKDLPTVLQSARAVARINGDGNVECFEMSAIGKDSVFLELGVQDGDCLKLVRLFDKDANGGLSLAAKTELNSPAAAMQLYSGILSAAKVELTVLRSAGPHRLIFLVNP